MYIVRPTLETLMSSCDDCKARAGMVELEYSNFRKQCKMRQNMGIETYAKCAAAFDRDVLIIHLPKGMMDETGIRPVMHDDGRHFTIEKEDLISLLNRLCGIDEGRAVQHIIHVFHELDAMFSHTEDGSKGKALKDFITRKIHGHG